MRLHVVLAAMLAGTGLVYSAPPSGVPDPEIGKPDSPLVLPPVPRFEVPAQEPGVVDPRYLRLRGKKLLGTQVKVKGYITWIYDCVSDNRQPAESREHTQQRIDADPTLCERPKFYLGSTRDASPDKALWVVDVPRPPNKLEKERLPKEELAAWPSVPRLKVGDYVVVTGEFKLSSPHNERNSDGLVVFQAIESAKPRPLREPASSPVATLAVAPKPRAVPARPAEKPVDPKVVNISMISLELANKAARNKQLGEAIDRYRRALASWDGNHLAWYGLGGAYAQKGDWQAALDAFAHATALRPDAAMYQMWTGIAAYEAEAIAARHEQAAKLNVDPEHLPPDLSAAAFDQAREHLETAVAIEPALWRAQYYLGKIARDVGREQEAAGRFAAAIRGDRQQQAPYIVLAELYRKWDYTQEAIAVATLGTKELPPSPAVSNVYYVLGMAYGEQRKYKQAIEAFTRALELKPDHHDARFQRGQAWFRLGKLEDAKQDLEAFVSGDASASLSFAEQQARQVLLEIAAKKK